MNQSERDGLLKQIAQNVSGLPERLTQVEVRVENAHERLDELDVVTEASCEDRRKLIQQQTTLNVARVHASALIKSSALKALIPIAMLGIGALIGWLVS